MKGERGFALVITLIVTALLVALLVEFVNEVYVDTSHSHNFVASQQASILAESGIDGGKQLLQFASVLRMGANYSSLTEVWAQPQSLASEEGAVTVAIEEESGKLNLNQATSAKGTDTPTTEMARRLFKKLGLSTDLVEVLMDWVDDDDTPHAGGAETNYYSTLKTPYRAKNARLETFEELALLKGFTPEVLAKLKPMVTVYSSIPNEPVTLINVNTARREVLASLDAKMSDDLVSRIIDYRTTRPIKDQKDLLSIPGVDAVIQNIGTYLTYSGTVWRIRAEGRVKESVSVAEAVVGQTGFLYWREY